MKSIFGIAVIAALVLSAEVLTSQVPGPTPVQGQVQAARGRGAAPDAPAAQGARGRGAAAADVNGVTAGDFLIDPPTLINLRFECFIHADKNWNATVAVSYRKKGESL